MAVLAKRAAIAAVLLASIPVPAGADPTAAVSVTEGVYLWSSSFENFFSIQGSVYVEQRRTVGAAIEPAPGAVNETETWTVEGYVSYCDYTDFDPCGSTSIPKQPATGVQEDLLSGSISMNGFVSTSSGIQPIAFDISRPEGGTVYPTNFGVPSAWVDGSEAGAGMSHQTVLVRDTYAQTSLTLVVPHPNVTGTRYLWIGERVSV